MSCKSLGSVVQVAMLSPLLNTASRSRRRTSPESQQQDATGHTCAVGAHCAWKERLVGRQPQRQVSTPGRRRIGSSHCWPFFFIYIYLFIYLIYLFYFQQQPPPQGMPKQQRVVGQADLGVISKKG